MSLLIIGRLDTLLYRSLGDQLVTPQFLSTPTSLSRFHIFIHYVVTGINVLLLTKVTSKYLYFFTSAY